MAGFSCPAPIETIALKCDGRVGRPASWLGMLPSSLSRRAPPIWVTLQ